MKWIVNLLVILILSAGCKTDKSASVIKVASYQELSERFKESAAGDVFVLADGIYDGDPLELKANGTIEQPIVIRSENLHGAKFATELQIRGNYIRIEGCQFVGNGWINMEGRGIRMSRCLIKDSKARKWVRVLPGSMEIEIDHNQFENKNSNIGNRSCQLLQVVVLNQNERHHIHHNLFRDIPKGTENNGNGYETVQLITKDNPFNPPPGDCNSIIEHNLFVRANGEAEIISVKSNSNIIRNNTFRACQGGLVLRHGHGNVATANVVFADGEEKASGIRFQGRNQVVANNYFEGLGGYGIGMMDGTPDDLYVRVEHGIVAFNTFINCNKVLEIGLNHSKHPNGTPPKGCQIVGNIFYADEGANNNSSFPFVVLVQGDEPEQFVWEGNVAFGKKAEDSNGISYLDPKLQFKVGTMAVPGAVTPVINHGLREDPRYSVDLAGAAWKNQRSIGALQYTSDLEPVILNEKMVGPWTDGG